MRYEETPPSDALAPYIERFWSFAVEAHEPEVIEHVIPPDGCINIAIMRPAPQAPLILGVSGPALKAVRMQVHKGVRYFGLRLRPEAADLLTGGKAEAVVGTRCGLHDLNPTLAQALGGTVAIEADLVAFVASVTPSLMAVLCDGPLPDQAVVAVVDRLIEADPDLTLSEVLTASGLSERQMRRRFVRATGLTPKTFARIRRVRRAIVDLTLNLKASTADVSFAHGFADQPHLAREVREVFDLSANLLTQYLNQITHINLAERQ